MSLYNAIRGFNPNVGICVLMLGLTEETFQEAFGRFRDAWFSDDGKEICVLTRTGGPNRDAHAEHHARVVLLRGYLRNEDDTFDKTYARFYYAVPDECQADTLQVASLMVLAGKGAATQGPEGVLRLLEREGREDLPKVNQDDPRIEAAWLAYRRLTERFK